MVKAINAISTAFDDLLGGDVVTLDSRQGRLDRLLPGLSPLVEAGCALHWLKPRSKTPVETNWSNRPFASLADLQTTYRDGYNLGVRLGEPSQVAEGYLHVLDIDIRVDDLKDEAWDAVNSLFPDVNISDLPCVQSGSGGESRHLYLILDKPFRSKLLATSPGKHKRVKDGKEGWSYDWEVELYGTSKQVVVPPSIHPESGEPYRWLREFDFDFLNLGIGPFVPSSAIERLSLVEHATYEFETREPLIFKGDQLERALAVINISELHYNDWLRIGQALHHQFGGGEEGFDLWLKHTKRSTKFTGDKQIREMRRVKWKSFGRYRGKPVTMATVVEWASAERDVARSEALRSAFEEADATPTPVSDLELLGEGPAEDNEDTPDWVKHFNEQHALARVAGKLVVLNLRPNGQVSYSTVTDLHNLYSNVPSRTTNGFEPISKAWMKHRKRLTYREGVVFAPGGAPPEAYNLWQGFDVERDASAGCRLFLRHLQEVVCSGDDATYQWVIRWFAHMIQRPSEKPGTALVLKGQKGTGKDTVGNYVGSLFSRHHTKIANPEHLHGRFNAHLEQTLLLHLEEGFWAGDKTAESNLKHVITSERMSIEHKGVNTYQADSVLRVFISSNEDWVVPASDDERRFCVLNVSNRHAGDEDYFARLHHERNHGGRAALLHHLQTLDLSGFDVRKPPMTEGLRDQKLQSLKNINRWWYETLTRGELPGVQVDLEQDATAAWSGPLQASRDSLRQAYKEWVKEHRFEGQVLGVGEFGKKLRAICPIEDGRPRNSTGSRIWVYVVPSLPVCRTAFERFVRYPIDWPDGMD